MTPLVTILLDVTLRVVGYTPSAAEPFLLISSDLGRTLTELTRRLKCTELQEDARHVLERRVPVTREIKDSGGRWFLAQILPYCTMQEEAAGIVLTLSDITDRSRTEEQYRLLFDQVDEGFYLAEVIFNGEKQPVDILYLDENPAAIRMIGRALKGRRLSEIHPEYEDYWFEIFGKVASTGEAQRLQLYAKPNNKLFDFYVFRAGDTGSRRIAIIFQDITERKRVEDGLRNSERRLQMAMQAGRIFSWELNPATRRFEWSSNAENIVGFSLLHDIDKTFELIHPDDLQPTLDAINRSIDTGEDHVSEYRLVNPATGETFWFRSRGAMTNQTVDGLPRFVGITQNISEQKRAALNGEFLASITEDLARLATADEIMRTVGAKIGAYLDLSFCVFVELDPETNQAVVRHHWRKADTQRIVGSYRISEFLNNEFLRAARTGQISVVPDVQSNPRLDAGKYAAPEIRAYVSVPQLRNGEWRFTLSLYSSRARNWRADELEVAQELVARIWTRLERAHAEEALRASETRLSVIFTHAAVGLSELSRDGRFIRVNEEICGILNRSRKSLLSMRVTDVTHPEDIRASREAVGRVLETGERITLDKRYLRPDGTVVWANSTLSRLDQPGQPSSLLAVTADLTQRKEAEEALRESEARFRAVANLVPDLLWSNDPAGSVTWFNQRWLDVTGQTFDQALGNGWLEALAPEHRESYFQSFQAGIASGQPFQAEHCIRGVEGENRWFLVRAKPVYDDKGRVIQWFGSATDIDDLKRAEAAVAASQERLRLIVENARDYAIFSTDVDRRVTSWNPGAEQLLGYSEQEILCQNGDTFFVAEDRDAGVPDQEAHSALAEGRALDERWHVRKDGSRFWASGVTTAMYNTEGEVIGFVKILRDQTEARRAKEVLEQSQLELQAALQETEAAREEAEAAGRAKDHFLAVLSHELRTPLTPVFMALAMMERRADLPPAVKDSLEMIARNVQLEASLIDDLLDLTRIAQGKVEIACESLDLHQVVQGAVEVSRPDIEAKGQLLTVSLEAGEHSLTGDAARLQQAFWNLLKNASKFTPEGGEIRITSRNETGRIVVEVSDTGVGFEPEAAERIFDAFEQANQTVTREFGGLGLGLAIAKATVTAHGGTIRAESAGLAKGATFRVSLPISSGN